MKTKHYVQFVMVFLIVVQQQCVLSLFSVITSTKMIYDSAWILKIYGTGFKGVNVKDITIQISAQNKPSLKAGEDYLISENVFTGKRRYRQEIDMEKVAFAIRLTDHKKWVDLGAYIEPLPLVLSSVKVGASDNLLSKPVVVAHVIHTPSISEDLSVIYSSLTPELRIKGTGLIGARSAVLHFNPPQTYNNGTHQLAAYDDISKYPLATNEITLKLKPGNTWRKVYDQYDSVSRSMLYKDVSGPLSVVAVDTGGGVHVIPNRGDGTKVANVVNDTLCPGPNVKPPLPFLDVSASVESTHIYDDQTDFTIRGTGFNPRGTNTVLFDHPVNCTVMNSSETHIHLRLLTPGDSLWRPKSVQYPSGVLTVVAIDAGRGFQNLSTYFDGQGRFGGDVLGRPGYRQGIDVATVHERPFIDAYDIRVNVNPKQSKFRVTGRGFEHNTRFRLSAPLEYGVDYTTSYLLSSAVEFHLVKGHVWRSDPGPIYVTAINARPDNDETWMELPNEGVAIANIDTAKPKFLTQSRLDREKRRVKREEKTKTSNAKFMLDVQIVMLWVVIVALGLMLVSVASFLCYVCMQMRSKRDV